MPMVHTGEVSLHVQRLAPSDGRPPTATAVLLHGLLTDSLASYYFTVAHGLAAAGIDVVMYDLRGHGRSGRPPTGYHLGAFVTDLEDLLERLGIGGPVHLVGNSFGGTVAFGYTVRHPDRVAGLSVVESEPATAGWARKLRGILGRTVEELAANEADALAWISTHRGPHTARLARSAARLVRTTTIARDIPRSPVLGEDDIRAVRCPVLAVYGGDSDLAGLAPWLESLLPRCRTVVVPGREHSILVEVPGLVLEAVLACIREGAGPVGVEAG